MALDDGQGPENQVEIWADHCETVTTRDTGLNIAEHPESYKLGFEDVEQFEQMVDTFDKQELNTADSLAYTVSQEAEDIDELDRIAKEAQIPFLQDYGDGFLHLNRYLGQPITVVTAGLEEPPLHALQQLLQDDAPEVYGARIKQNGSGLEVGRYCSGQKKLKVLEQEKGYKPEEVTSIAFGNSSNDKEIMENSEEAFGRDRARKYSTLYFPDDSEGWGRTASAIAARELLNGKEIEEAREETFRYIESGRQDYGLSELEEPEIVQEGPFTEQIADIYEDITEEYRTVEAYR